MNFGKWIVVAFVFFALFIGALVAVCVREDIALVSREYYKEELAYQDQIERINNAHNLPDQPEISFVQGKVHVDYSRFPEIDKGTLQIMRPSDARLDQRFAVEPSSGTSQTFELDNPARGLYRARLTWEQHGREYYVEKVIVL